MKFLLLLSALLLVSFSCSFAAESIGFFADPKYPGKCVIKPDFIISESETVQNPNGCGRIICSDQGMATFHTCGVISTSDDCRLGKFLFPDAVYPKCCEREILC